MNSSTISADYHVIVTLTSGGGGPYTFTDTVEFPQ
jgi:hypothetical protein